MNPQGGNQAIEERFPQILSGYEPGKRVKYTSTFFPFTPPVVSPTTFVSCRKFFSLCTSGLASRINSIEKLHGSGVNSNYSAWRFVMTRLLKERGVWEVVAPPVSSDSGKSSTGMLHEKKDNAAFSLIAGTVSLSQIGFIEQCGTAREAWEKLAEIHEGIGARGRRALTQQLTTMRLSEGGDVQAHLDTFKRTATRLNTLGATFDDIDLVNWLIISLPKSYDPLAMSLDLDAASTTLDHVIARIRMETSRREARRKAHSGVATAFGTV